MRGTVVRSLQGVFINRNYGLFLGGSFVSALGSWLLTVAQGWLVLQLGNSDFLLGLANFAQMAPLLVFGVVGGAVADRIDRRLLLLVTQFASFLAAAALAALAVTGRLSVSALLIVALAFGLANVLMWPTWSAFIKDLVGPEQLRLAVATNSARFNLTRVLGPAIGGLILARYGAAACLVLGTAMMLGVTAALLAIQSPPRQPSPAPRWRQALTQGVSYAWRHRPVRDVLLLTSVIALFGSSYQAFLPAFARDVLHAGPEGLGWELGAVGIGAIAGAVVSGHRIVARRPGQAMLLLLAVTGGGLLWFAAARDVLPALLALAIVGFATIGFLSTANASVQLAAPNAIVGSVMGVWVVVNAGLVPVGSLLLGSAAEVTTVSLAVGASGLVCLCCAAGVLLRQWWVRRRMVPVPATGMPSKRPG